MSANWIPPSLLYIGGLKPVVIVVNEGETDHVKFSGLLLWGSVSLGVVMEIHPMNKCHFYNNCKILARSLANFYCQ